MNKQLRSKYFFVPVATPLSALEKVTCPWSQVNGHPRSAPVTPFLTILSHLSCGWFYIAHQRCGLFHLCHWLWFWFFPDRSWKPTITSSHTDTSSHQTETPSGIKTVPNQLIQVFLPNSVFLSPMLYISRAALRLCPSPRNLAFEGFPQEAIPRKVSSQKTGTETRNCLGPPSLLSPVHKTNYEAAVLNPGCKIK